MKIPLVYRRVSYTKGRPVPLVRAVGYCFPFGWRLVEASRAPTYTSRGCVWEVVTTWAKSPPSRSFPVGGDFVEFQLYRRATFGMTLRMAWLLLWSRRIS